MTWGIIGAMPVGNRSAGNADVRCEKGSRFRPNLSNRKNLRKGCCAVLQRNRQGQCLPCAPQTLALRYNVDYMVNTGVAGCTCDDLGVLDIVLSRDLVFHDFDWEIMEDYHPHTSKFPGDPSLIALAQPCAGADAGAQISV